MVPKRQKTLICLMLCSLGALLLGQVLSMTTAWEPETVIAQLYTGEDPIYVSGVVIRDEVPIIAETSGNWIHQVADGEKVAAGQTLFRWEDPQTLEDAARMVRILRIGEEAAAEPLFSRRENLHGTIAMLGAAEGTDRRSYSEMLTGYLLGETDGLETRLEEAEEALTSQDSGAGRVICAPEAGIFVSATDGLESTLTMDNPWAEWSLPLRPVMQEAMGRLVLGDTWFYRTELSFVPEIGEALKARLLGGIFQTVEMTVEEVHPQNEGCLVLLSCQEALAEVSEIRQLELKILPDSESGVEIPAAALYTVEEEIGVWCLVGEAAKFKPLTILKELEDTVVVELDQSTTEGLWPGDVVLLDYR